MYLHKVGSNIYATSPEVPVSIIYYSWQSTVIHCLKDTLLHGRANALTNRKTKRYWIGEHGPRKHFNF